MVPSGNRGNRAKRGKHAQQAVDHGAVHGMGFDLVLLEARPRLGLVFRALRPPLEVLGKLAAEAG